MIPLLQLALLQAAEATEAARGAPELTRQDVVRALVLLLAGGAFVWLLGRLARARIQRRGHPHEALVVHKLITYVGVALVVLLVVQSLGGRLSTWLATAGVLTIGIGFAAQTSLSNLIAGIFLLIDRPFQVGNAIELEGRAGIVEEITLLSTYVRTFDNIRVRWPNEVVLKATILNLARFAARRIDLRVGIAHGSDVERARQALLQAVGELHEVLVEPPPEVWARGLLESSIDVEVRAWVPRTEFLEARSVLVRAVHDTLRGSGIELALPQRAVWVRGDGRADARP